MRNHRHIVTGLIQSVVYQRAAIKMILETANIEQRQLRRYAGFLLKATAINIYLILRLDLQPLWSFFYLDFMFDLLSIWSESREKSAFKRAKCTDYPAHAQSIIRVFALHSYILLAYSEGPDQHHENTPIYFDPLKPHFYTVKRWFAGLYIIFLISAQKHRCGYSWEPPCRGGSHEYPQSVFWAEIWKISAFFIWKFSVLGGKIFYIFE